MTTIASRSRSYPLEAVGPDGEDVTIDVEWEASVLTHGRQVLELAGEAAVG